jgi:hypothetical protein
VGAAFGKAAFIDDEHREGRLGLRTLRQTGGGGQRLDDKRAQFITNAFFVPGGSREQALDAIGLWLSGVFSDLPAIFSGDLAENGLQVEQGMMMGFVTSKMGAQTLMQLAQAHEPSANRTQSCPGFFGCGMVKMLHAFLVSDGSLNEEVLVLLACHIGVNGTKFFRSGDLSWENSRENGSY